MKKKPRVVRLSSKGQIVIPAGIRRDLGLHAGQALEVRTQMQREVVFSPIEKSSSDLKELLDRARDWVEQSGRDLVEELHVRRRQEREKEAMKRARRGP